MDPEQDTTILRNAGNYLPNDTSYHPSELEISASYLRETRIFNEKNNDQDSYKVDFLEYTDPSSGKWTQKMYGINWNIFQEFNEGQYLQLCFFERIRRKIEREYSRCVAFGRCSQVPMPPNKRTRCAPRANSWNWTLNAVRFHSLPHLLPATCSLAMCLN